MKKLIEKLIRQKNPDFKLDTNISSGMLFSFFISKVTARMRSFRLMIFGKWPGSLFLGRGVRFFNLKNISFGRMVQLEEYVYLSALGSGELKLGDHVRIGAFSRLVISTSFNNIGNYIKIGNHVGIGEFAYIGGAGGLEIGDHCIIGQYLSCHPENHIFENPDQLIRLQGVTRKGIKVGRNCWIGSKVTILDGVTIGDNCVIAAGAVITRSMPSGVLIGGVPAKVIREIKVSDRILNPTF